MFTALPTRLTILSLALLTAAAQDPIAVGGFVVTEGEEVAVQAMPPGEQPPQVVIGEPGTGGPGGDLDFNRLRQMIEQSKKRPPPTPAQQMAAALRELRFDRSPAGILGARLE